ncbi:hypothetical protein KIW84_057507 [Lathyrus oleraceus]|uniref:non-specific serine/threonine protein kinase n=1 Tax=Pisum sativum TaxID=3888 RepID=A0A9D4X4L8_PEA|nr:hypothetical protein KIW84_057507 [Pisum sativum]
MKHRSLVGFRGWCKEGNGNLILVYDFMNNGSLDKWIFECEEGKMLTWDERIQVLKNVAAGILYLHEGWEVKVLHRDIKASNVLLDKDMNARLGDFGLALMHEHHGQVASTTKVLGTLGYIAPEVIRTGRASTMSDVFGFGILVLEVICGRRPIEEHKLGLIESVESLMVLDQLHNAVDERLKDKGGYNVDEAERLLHLGLLCSNPDPSVRPIMRQVVKMLEGEKDCIDSEEENMETSLLGRINSAAIWSRTESAVPNRDHLTFEEIRMFSYNSKASTSGSNSIPTSDSDVIRDGRYTHILSYRELSFVAASTMTIMAINAPTLLSWITYIKEYNERGNLPLDPLKAMLIKRKFNGYAMVGESYTKEAFPPLAKIPRKGGGRLCPLGSTRREEFSL